MAIKTILRIFPALLLMLIAAPAVAQLPTPTPEETTAAEADPFMRDTPRSAITAFMNALAKQDYVRAGNYFALESEGDPHGAVLARALQASLDAGGNLVPYAELSSDPAGAIDDGLPPEQERVGTLGGGEQSPILLERSEGEGGTIVWRIASETIDQLEARAELLPEPRAAEDRLVIAGAPLTDWLVLFGILVGIFLVLSMLSALFLMGLRSVLSEPKKNAAYRFLNAALPPFSLMFAVFVFQVWGGDAPVSIVARQTFLRYSGILSSVAIVWFAFRLVDAVAHTLTSRMERSQRRQALSVVTLARRAAKVLLAVIALVAILDTLGIDVTTGIAALGIGGLALALGAQKTIENLVGSVTVIADRPIQVGDFCRVGELLGTIEDIGMRSTRIRTLERTIVTIPNGEFSSLQIENFATRDRFLFNPVIALEYGMSAAQLREAISLIESVLIEHEHVSDDPRRAKLSDFGANSLEIGVFTYITVSDFNESLKIRQELLLSIFERLEEAGFRIALPTRAIYLRDDGSGSAADGDAKPLPDDTSG